MTRCFEYENGYIGVTSKSPKGMKGVIFIGRGPNPREGIESVCEQPYARNRLERLKEVKEKDVPDDWYMAIGYGKPRDVEPRLDPSVNLDVDFDESPGHAPAHWSEPEPKVVPFEPIYLQEDLKRLHRVGFIGWSMAISLVLMVVWRVIAMR